MAFLETAKNHLRCPTARVTLVEDASDFDFKDIRDGVVIFLATWSGPARAALEMFSERLNSLRVEIPVWVIDVDTLPANGPVHSHGWGEAVFLKNGHQVDQLLRSKGDRAQSFAEKYEAVFGD